MAKYIRVNINYNGVIPILGCWGPVKNMLLTEAQIKNLQHVLGEDKVELIVKKPKKEAIKIKVDEIIEVKPIEKVEEVKEEEPKEEVQSVEEEVITIQEEVKEEIQSVEEVVKPTPKRRGGRKPKKQVEIVEEVKEEEPKEEVQSVEE